MPAPARPATIFSGFIHRVPEYGVVAVENERGGFAPIATTEDYERFAAEQALNLELAAQARHHGTTPEALETTRMPLIPGDITNTSLVMLGETDADQQGRVTRKRQALGLEPLSGYTPHLAIDSIAHWVRESLSEGRKVGQRALETASVPVDTETAVKDHLEAVDVRVTELRSQILREFQIHDYDTTAPRDQYGNPYRGYSGDPRNAARRPGNIPQERPIPAEQWYAGKPVSGVTPPPSKLPEVLPPAAVPVPPDAPVTVAEAVQAIEEKSPRLWEWIFSRWRTRRPATDPTQA